jgi:hypothetical protein
MPNFFSRIPAVFSALIRNQEFQNAVIVMAYTCMMLDSVRIAQFVKNDVSVADITILT